MWFKSGGWLRRAVKPANAGLVLIFILAAFLRGDFLLSVGHKVSHDTMNYDLMVRQLLETGVYGYKSETPNAQVTPGYPLTMAAVYSLVDYRSHDPFPYIRWMQAGMSMVTMGLIYLIARRLGGRRTGWIAALITAVYPPFIWANGAILTEVLANMLLTLYVYLQLIAFDRRTRLSAILAGAAMGLTVLTRPEFLVLLGAAYGFYWLWRKKTHETLKLLLFSVAGAAVILMPWVIRNAVTLHELVVASTQVNPFTAGTYPNKNYEDGLVDRHGKTQMEVARERLRIGFTEHTWTFVKWYTVGKLKLTYARMFFGAGHSPLYPVIPLRNLFHVGLIAGGALSILSMLKAWRQPAMLLGVLLAVISVVRLAFVPEYRYNFTAMPMFIILTSLLAAVVLQTAARWNSREKAYAEGEITHAE